MNSKNQGRQFLQEVEYDYSLGHVNYPWLTGSGSFAGMNLAACVVAFGVKVKPMPIASSLTQGFLRDHIDIGTHESTASPLEFVEIVFPPSPTTPAHSHGVFVDLALLAYRHVSTALSYQGGTYRGTGGWISLGHSSSTTCATFPLLRTSKL